MLKKRAFSLLMVLILMFAVSGARLCYLAADTGDARAAAGQSSVRVTLTRPRGTIYDTNLRPITNAQKIYLASVAPTTQAVAEITRKLSPEAAAEALERLKAGKPIVLEVPADFSAEGAYVFESYAHYSEAQTAPHITGYLNEEGHGVSGVEQAYDDALFREETLDVIYTTDAHGRVLTGIEPRIEGYDPGDQSGVALTIDTRVQKIVEDVARERLDAGAVVVLEPGTGKIRAACSVPDFSPLDLAKSLNAANSPLFNRALSAYNVGSVFKPAVAAAALESGVPDSFSYTCKGSITLRGITFHCHEEKGHGALDLDGGLCQSCNPYFINLARRTGADALFDMCLALRFDEALRIADEMSTDAGVLPALWKLQEQPAALANLSFGQGELMLTPLHIAAMVNAIISGGEYRIPRLVEGLVGTDGTLSREQQSSAARVMKKATADRVREMMIDVVAKGTGSSAQPENGGAGGKTATAETGWVRDGREVNQTWFAGFYPAQQPKYIIVVLGEDGVSGSLTAAPVFKEIAEKLGEMAQ